MSPDSYRDIASGSNKHDRQSDNRQRVDFRDVSIGDGSIILHCPTRASAAAAAKAWRNGLAIRTVDEPAPCSGGIENATADDSPPLTFLVKGIALERSSAFNVWHASQEALALVQHVATTPGCDRDGCPHRKKVLYVPDAARQRNARRGLAIVQLLDHLFDEVRSLPRGGASPVCAREFAPGDALRTLNCMNDYAEPYTDEHRGAATTLNRVLQRHCGVSGGASSSAADQGGAPRRVLYVQRKPSSNGQRHVHPAVVASFEAAFRAHGFALEKCCDWANLNLCKTAKVSSRDHAHTATPLLPQPGPLAVLRVVCHRRCKDDVAIDPAFSMSARSVSGRLLPQLFGEAAFVVGMHGAGLTNALLAPRGAVLVELAGWFKSSNDLFRKVSLARFGGYVSVGMQEEPQDGSRLGDKHVRLAVDCAVAVWKEGRAGGLADGHGISDGSGVGVAGGGGGGGGEGSNRSSSSFPSVAFTSACRGSFLHRNGGRLAGLIGAAPVGHDADCSGPGEAVFGGIHRTCWGALGLPDPFAWREDRIPHGARAPDWSVVIGAADAGHIGTAVVRRPPLHHKPGGSNATRTSPPTRRQHPPAALNLRKPFRAPPRHPQNNGH